jgi:hypothetical protein
MARSTATAPARVAPVHTVTHITGRRVTCTCGWSTAGNVESQVAGQMIGEDHIRRVTQ